MKKMTDDNLRAAFAGESQAHAKYQIFARKAEKEGRSNLARLFRAVAHAELIHAKTHLKALGEVGESADNLSKAISGEAFEIDEMYPAYEAIAKLQDEKTALRAIKWAVEAERQHKELFETAKAEIDRGADSGPTPIFVCDECGYTVEGAAPEKCPLCGKPKERFIGF
ncbi:MAG: rubrerythrin family protein [Deltaproteobacteria bacterium]